jgi:hypothetical protein
MHLTVCCSRWAEGGWGVSGREAKGELEREKNRGGEGD